MALVRGDGGLEEGCVETVEGSKVLQSEGTVLYFHADRDHQTTSFLHATPQFLDFLSGQASAVRNPRRFVDRQT